MGGTDGCKGKIMSKRFHLDDFEVCSKDRSVTRNGSQIAIGTRGFDLLLCLVDHRDGIVSKDELLKQVWPGLVVAENNLTVQISALRKILGARSVRTITGRGYQLRMTVIDVPDAPEQLSHTTNLKITDKPFVVVLPFANLSGSTNQDYFIDGVVDDIISALSRVRAFFVISRTSSFVYKGKSFDIKHVASELGVRYILQGSFRKAGDKLRISCELIEPVTGRHLWTDKFEGSLDGIFEFQDHITQSVVGSIEPILRVTESEWSLAKLKVNLRAYDLCLRALPKMYPLATREDNDNAIALLQHAIAVDPGYAYAKAACAFAFMLRNFRYWATEEEVQEGIRLTDEAMTEHRNDPATLRYAAHTLVSLAFRYDEGMLAIDRALALNPNSPLTLNISGWVRCFNGDGAVAIGNFRQALRLNPMGPDRSYLLSGLSFACNIAGLHEESMEHALRSIHEAPNWIVSHRTYVVSLVQLGRVEEAKVAAQHMMKLTPLYSLTLSKRQMPMRDQAFKERYISALRIAGVPE